MGQRVRLLLRGAVIFALTLVALGWTAARADHDPGSSTIDIVAFDTDTSGNTPTSVGTIEDCISLAAVGDTATVDVIVDQVPADGAGGIEGAIVYSSSIVRVNASVGTTMMLGAGASSSVTGFTNPLPDSDGTFGFAYIDSSTDYESGEGVMIRLTLQAVGTGRATLSIQDPDANPYPLVYAPDTSSYAIDNVVGGTIAVGVPCSTGADLQAVSASTSAPASANLGTPFNVTVSGSVRNNGAVTPANGDVAVTLNLPTDCSAAGGNTRSIQDQALSLGTPLPVNEVFSVTCFSPSFHSFAGTIAVTLDDPAATDNVAGNNQASSTSATTAISAVANLSVASVVVTTSQYTATPMSGVSFDLVATIGVHNAGPDGPVLANGLATATVPADCNVWSPQPESYSVQAGASQTATAVIAFHVRCTTPGDHSFTVNTTVSSPDIHVSDAGGNNSGQGSGTFTLKVVACGPDPAPAGSITQNLSPQLLLLIQQLTGTGTPVAEALKLQIQCDFAMHFRDVGNTPNDDCPIDLLAEKPCSVSFPLSLDLIGGSPLITPTGQLNPIGIVFVPPELDWATDAEVPNGTPTGSANFGIRTDAGLYPNNIRCTIDANLSTTVGIEGGLLGSVPESNLDSALSDPNLWPNDLNAEKALVESSFAIPIIGGSGVTLHSRTIVPLVAGDLAIYMNVLTWKVTNPIFQAITGAGWVIVPFPGDALGPDAPGTIGGNPDADDPAPPLFPINYCLPHHVTLSFNGMAGNTVFLACNSIQAGIVSPMGWVLVDPDAVNVTGDDGPRSDISTCSPDLDGDGLGQNSETYWGSNPLSTDSDADGIPDGPDNCRTIPNLDQADYDGDGIGDICDTDVDGDGAPNVSDLCPMTAVGVAADSAGCSKAQVDADGDDVCDPGAPSTGPVPCTGTDLCPSTASGDAVDPVAGCSKAQVDADDDDWCNPGAPSGGPVPCSFTDNCPFEPNNDQLNSDGDEFGDACDGCPIVIQHWVVPTNDTDCDGYPDSVPGPPVSFRAGETVIGTLPLVRCAATPAINDEPGADAWPVDFNDNQLVNGADWVSFNAKFGATSGGVLGQGGEAYNARWDLNANGIINGADMLQLNPFFFKRCDS